jgi:hypothetical protein
MHRSAEFNRYNKIVIDAGEQFDGLPWDQQAAWRIPMPPWPVPPWWLWCYVGTIYPYSFWDGREQFKGSQAWRAAQGLPGSLIPPSGFTQAADDSLGVAAGAGVSVTWCRTPAPLPGGQYLVVYVRPVLSRVPNGRQLSRYRLAGLVGLAVGVPVNVSGLIRDSQAAGPGNNVALRLLVGDVGSVPFTGSEAVVPGSAALS